MFTPALRDSLAAHTSRLTEDLQSLVRTPTVSGDEDAAEPFLLDWFTSRGWAVTRQPFAGTDAAQTTRGMSEPRQEQRANITGWLGVPSGKPVVTLNAHYDTVPVFDQGDWRDEPFSGELRDGAVFGRGSVDNKGGCAAALYALQALADANVELEFDLAVELIMAEETTGLGTVASLEQLPERLATIVIEPTDGAIVIANSGALFFTIETTGRAVHTSVPWRGEDALSHLVKIYESLSALGRRRDDERRHPLMSSLPTSVPLVIGMFTGGGWRASVPGHASMSGRIGALPGESLDAVRAELQAAVGEVAGDSAWWAEHPVVVRWDNDGLPGWELAADHELVRAMVGGQRSTGSAERVEGITSGCDAGTLNSAGIPVVVFGPGDMARAHSPNEFVRIDEVIDASAVLAAALVEFSAQLSERTR